MHHYLMLLGVVAAVTINGQGTEDAPVIITNPVDLDRPQTLVRITTTELTSLSCSAQNADTVEWKFKATQAVPFTDLQTSLWTQDTLVGTERTTVLKEKDGINRTLLNGYYQCVAGNTFGYKAISPPIRILSPNILSSLPTDTSPPNAVSRPDGKDLRLPCYSGSGSLQINPSDYFELFPVGGEYKWTRTLASAGGDITSQITSEKERINIDPKTGDLFFKFLTSDDQRFKEYRCSLQFTREREAKLIGIHILTITVADAGDSITLLYPKTNTERSVTCREGITCYLPCLYGGRVNGQPPGNGTLTPPGKVVETRTTSTGSSILNPSADAAGRWTCSLDSSGSAETAKIDVTVLTYPAIAPNSMASQAVITGSEVKFNCLPVTSSVTPKFYKNGNELNAGVTDSSIVFKNVQRNDSSSISCVMSNDVGSTFKTTTLVVYDLSITGQPASGHSVPENVTLEEYTFNCSVALDSRALNPKLYWKTTVVGLEKRNIITKTPDVGVMDVRIPPIPPQRYYHDTFNTSLRIKYNSITKDTFRNSTWWCECAFEIAVGGGKVENFVPSNIMNFTILAHPRKDNIQKAFASWWVIGVIIAVIFFILIIILMIYCVKQNVGEQYYVDEKERKAGHDPELELEQKGFHDYHRPNEPDYKGQTW